MGLCQLIPARGFTQICSKSEYFSYRHCLFPSKARDKTRILLEGYVSWEVSKLYWETLFAQEMAQN